MQEQNFHCITCPFGCMLNVIIKDQEVTHVEGHRCKRGVAYAQQEAIDPRRVFSTVVPVEGGILDCVPVKLTAPVKKAHVLKVAREVQSLTLKAPVDYGQVIMENVDGEPGVSWIAIRPCPVKKAATP